MVYCSEKMFIISEFLVWLMGIVGTSMALNYRNKLKDTSECNDCDAGIPNGFGDVCIITLLLLVVTGIATCSMDNNFGPILRLQILCGIYGASMAIAYIEKINNSCNDDCKTSSIGNDGVARGVAIGILVLLILSTMGVYGFHTDKGGAMANRLTRRINNAMPRNMI